MVDVNKKRGYELVRDAWGGLNWGYITRKRSSNVAK